MNSSLTQQVIKLIIDYLFVQTNSYLYEQELQVQQYQIQIVIFSHFKHYGDFWNFSQIICWSVEIEHEIELAKDFDFLVTITFAFKLFHDRHVLIQQRQLIIKLQQQQRLFVFELLVLILTFMQPQLPTIVFVLVFVVISISRPKLQLIQQQQQRLFVFLVQVFIFQPFQQLIFIHIFLSLSSTSQLFQ